MFSKRPAPAIQIINQAWLQPERSRIVLAAFLQHTIFQERIAQSAMQFSPSGNEPDGLRELRYRLFGSLRLHECEPKGGTCLGVIGLQTNGLTEMDDCLLSIIPGHGCIYQI